MAYHDPSKMGTAGQPEPGPPSPPAGGITPVALPGAQAAVGAPRSGQVVGYVAGTVSHGTERVSRTGVLVAAAAVAAAGPVMVIDLLQSRQRAVPDLVAILLATAAAAWLIRRVRLIPAKGQPFLAGPVVPRRAFVLRPVSGGEVTCVVYGDLGPDASWRHGDVLRVTGHQRSGRFIARRIDVLATPSGPASHTFRARGGAIVVANRWLNWAAWAAAAATSAYALAVVALIAHR